MGRAARGVDLLQDAGSHDGDAVAECHRLGLVVRRPPDRLAGLRLRSCSRSRIVAASWTRSSITFGVGLGDLQREAHVTPAGPYVGSTRA